MALEAALARAAGYIAPNDYETEAKRCACGAEIESWQTRCADCVAAEVSGVVIANSTRWLNEDARVVATCDGVVLCVDCPMRDTVDCEKYQEHLRSVGEGDDRGPSFWNLQTAEIAGAFSPRFD